MNCFESENKDANYANWTDRGYLMNPAVLYHHAAESEGEEPQLIVPEHERTLILQEHHDAPSAGHYGVEGTFN
ncbi:reverse transcriptase [Caerostris darwini]|uniref:Reverse transcriptase n=1 Tax=Caerostris darwini TaxID=1538125 RepID=A0AAV4VCS1_9ARAC|nr:reverse transcriptase [Caerostris darwini]